MQYIGQQSLKYGPYSFSRLDTHKQCNRKFKYRYVFKLQPTTKRDMTALLKGSAVHHILESYPNKSSHKLAEKYQHIVDNFANSSLGIKYLTRNSTREHNFGLTSNLTPTTYNDKKAIFRGSIDYICIIDDILHVIDWKSGKAKEQRWQSYNQLTYYSIYLFSKYKSIDKINISYVYIEHDNIENPLLLHRRFLKAYKYDLVTAISNAENDKEFKKNVSNLCEWCEFKDYCEKDNS